MLGIFKREKAIWEERLAKLRHDLASDVEEIVSPLNIAAAKLEERVTDLEELLRQNQRQERRRQMGLEALLEGQGKTLEGLEELKNAQVPQALLALAENLALVCLAEPEKPVFSVLYSKLIDLLACWGIVLITDVGCAFDPEKHEACSTRNVPYLPENNVLEVVRPGFLSNGSLLRCATVVVNRHSSPGDDASPSVHQESQKEERLFYD